MPLLHEHSVEVFRYSCSGIVFTDMSFATTIDILLDRTIVLGYGDVGLRVRSHLPDWPADPPRMDDQVVLVTGAASGIGLAACRGFARLGASVRPVARDRQRAQDAARQIADAVPGADVRPLACDVSSTHALRALAEQLCAQESRLDVLVNNAGTMPDERELPPRDTSSCSPPTCWPRSR